jgi:hypothetical protein
VRGPVAVLAARSIPVQLSARAPVNARGEFLDLVGVAGGAEGRAASGRLNNLVAVAMASHAGFGIIRLAQRRVSAAGPQLPQDFCVAGKTAGRGALCRVRELGCPGVATHAAKVFVDALGERLRLKL